MLFTFVSFLFVNLMVLLKPVLAYIDPGSGSMILQVLLAGILGGLFAIKMFWQKVKAFFSNLFGRKQNPDNHAD